MNEKPQASMDPVERAPRNNGSSCGPASMPAEAKDDCCSSKAGEIAALGSTTGARRVLQIVLAINLAMFFAEFTAGVPARSIALIAALFFRSAIRVLGTAWPQFCASSPTEAVPLD